MAGLTDQRLFKDSKTHKIVYHPGTDFGFYAMFARQPDNGNLVIFTEQYRRLLQRVCRRIDG
jgi:hypothetical protein